MVDLSNQTEYWNSVAWEKNFTIPLDIDRFKSLVSQDQRILDYGCGYGRIMAQLWDNGYRDILGVDPSSLMIQRAKKEHPHLDVSVLNGSLPFEPDSIDAVLLQAVLTCIPTNEGQQAVIEDIHRVLRPGGILNICDFPLQEAERYLAAYKESEGCYGMYGVFQLPDGGIVRHHDPKWVEELTAGFQPIDLFQIDVVTMNGHAAKAFQYFGRKPGR